LVKKDISSLRYHIAHQLLQLCFVYPAVEAHGQVAACSKCCSTAGVVTGTWKYECGLSQLMHDDLNLLVISQRVQYKLAVTVHRCLRHRAPWYLAEYCVSVSEVPGCQLYNLPDAINCQFREFALAPVLWHPCIFCRRTNSLEFTAWSSAGCSC